MTKPDLDVPLLFPLADALTRQEQILEELAELGAALARRVQERAMAAADVDDDEKLASLTSAFNRASRSVRQTLALRSRLIRQREADARKAGDDKIGGYVARGMIRKGQVRAALARSLRQQLPYEHEYEALLPALDEVVHEASLLDPEFVDGPFEAVVARVRADLALVAHVAEGEPPWSGSG